MSAYTFHQPDGEQVKKALEQYKFEPAGIVLYLAWQEGLTRKEIHDLTWDRVDFDNALLHLPDRDVPLEPEVAEALRRWRGRCEGFSSFVAVSDRLRKHMAPQSISRMVRLALDSVGQSSVRLQDLRYDYIRRQFEAHDWPYVLRVAGISLSTYRNTPSRAPERTADEAVSPEDMVGDEYRLWLVMQAEKSSPAGLALWLSTRLGLTNEEIVRLTWQDIDFDAAEVRTPRQTRALSVPVERILAEEYARRMPEDDPHVILTPQSRKPMDAARLTTVVRDALLRGGIENRTLVDFRRGTEREEERRQLRAYIQTNGSISRTEAAALLGVSKGGAYRRLAALGEAGELTRVNARWYPAQEAVMPEQRREAVLRLAEEMGTIRRADVTELLHIGKRTTSRLLRSLTDDGELVLLRPSQRYALPDSKCNNDTIG